MTLSDLAPYTRRRPGTCVIADERVGTSFEAELAAESGEFIEISRAIGSETKVFPDHHHAGAEFQEHALGKLAGALRSERAIEGNDDDSTAGHGSFAQAFFAFEWSEHGRGMTPEHFGGMRIEGEYERFEATRAGEIGSFAEHGAMSAMNSVEVADGHKTGRFFLFVHEAIHRGVRNQHGLRAQSLRRAKRISKDCALTVQGMTGSSAPPFKPRQRRLRR